MGIDLQVTWLIFVPFYNINIVDLRALCINVRNLNNNEKITVDVDCNWVANKLKSETEPAIILS